VVADQLRSRRSQAGDVRDGSSADDRDSLHVDLDWSLRETAGSFGNGVSWTRNYDSYLRPSLEQHTNSGGVFFGRGYGYDAANNVTSVAYQPESVYDLHTVDDLDRVTSSTIAANALTNPTSALGTLGSTLDGRGNRSQTSWTAWGSSTRHDVVHRRAGVLVQCSWGSVFHL
jgi:hypothetical protein